MNDEMISAYIEQLRTGDSEYAYSSLLTDISKTDVPKLIHAYHSETMLKVQAALVEIIWQQRLPETLEFIAVALENPHPEIWKSALDGIVAIGTPRAMTILQAEKKRLLALESERVSSRLEWIDEAIQQLSKV